MRAWCYGTYANFRDFNRQCLSMALLSIALFQLCWHIPHDQKILSALLAGFPAHQGLAEQRRSVNASFLFAV